VPFVLDVGLAGSTGARSTGAARLAYRCVARGEDPGCPDVGAGTHSPRLVSQQRVTFRPGGPHLVQVAIRLRGGWRLLATACRPNAGVTLGVAHSVVPMDYVIPTERRWIGRVQLRHRPPDTASLPLVGSPGQLDVEGALRALRGLRDLYKESSTLGGITAGRGGEAANSYAAPVKGQSRKE